VQWQRDGRRPAVRALALGPVSALARQKARHALKAATHNDFSFPPPLTAQAASAAG
jgi:hypothetical protein